MLKRILTPGLVMMASSGFSNQSKSQLEVAFEGLATVHKSELLQSNDLGSGYRMQVGNYAGRDGQLNFKFSVENQVANFKYANSSTNLGFKDTSLSYQLGRFYFGALHSQADIVLRKDGNDLHNLASSGYGGLVGLRLPFSQGLDRGGQFLIETSSTNYYSNKNVLTDRLLLNLRSDLEVRSELDLFKNTSFVVGSRVRFLETRSLKQSKEETYSTYLGLTYSINL